MITDYEALKRNAEGITTLARERLADSRSRSVIRDLFEIDSAAVIKYLFLLEQGRFPVGPDFEKEEGMYESSNDYRYYINGLQRHIERLRKCPKGYLEGHTSPTQDFCES